jgi:hypothetical protein|tara:strand:+ start:1548 stop:1898 length:351 start_codon:yes stop_codon:yes gene_type:complete
LLIPVGAIAKNATTSLLEELAESHNTSFSIKSGKETWFKKVDDRSCTSCHSESVLLKGSHIRTGKVIEPMAPSVNPERLTNIKKMKKWFLRNCKWTYNRECTAKEKGDILVWLQLQ